MHAQLPGLGVLREGDEGNVPAVVEDKGRILPQAEGHNVILIQLDGAGVEVYGGGGGEEGELEDWQVGLCQVKEADEVV